VYEETVDCIAECLSDWPFFQPMGVSEHWIARIKERVVKQYVPMVN